MTEQVETQLSETREIIGLLVKMDRAFADTMFAFDECAKDLKAARQERDEARTAAATAEARLAAMEMELLIAADVLNWGAEGLTLRGKTRLRDACDRARKAVREDAWKRWLAGTAATAAEGDATC